MNQYLSFSKEVLAAKGDVNRPDRHLFNRHSDGTGNEERPL